MAKEPSSLLQTLYSSKRTFPFFREVKPIPQSPSLSYIHTYVVSIKSPILFHFFKPEANGRCLWTLPNKRNARLGGVKEVTNN